MVTPPSIVPEWYLLPFYAILRSIPNKLLGVIAMFGSLLILLVLPFTDLSRIRGNTFRPAMKLAFWFFVVDFIILMWIGSQHPSTPFVEIGQVATAFYFSWVLIIVPLIGLVENTLFDTALDNKKNLLNTPLLSNCFDKASYNTNKFFVFWVNFNSKLIINIKKFIIYKEPINILKFLFIIFFFNYFVKDYSFDIGLLSLIISFLISFSISHFILEKFTFSDFIIIGLLQRFLIYYFIFFLAAFLLVNIFPILPPVKISPQMLSDIGEDDLIKCKETDVIKVTSETSKPSETDTEIKEYYNLKLSKELVDKCLNNMADTSKVIVDKIIPQLGVGIVIGAATSAGVKTTVGMPLAQRLITVGTTTAVSAIGVKVGLWVGKAITNNMGIEKDIKYSPHAEPNPDRIPSPDMSFINSPLERNELTSPLQELLLYSFVLDVSTLILFLIIILILLNKYIIKFNKIIFNSIIKKYFPIKFSNWVNQKFNTSIEFSNKFVIYISIYNCFFIFLFILLKIFITSELLVNIDSYVTVYNYLFSNKS